MKLDFNALGDVSTDYLDDCIERIQVELDRRRDAKDAFDNLINALHCFFEETELDEIEVCKYPGGPKINIESTFTGAFYIDTMTGIINSTGLPY